jgi:hypothetical protein
MKHLILTMQDEPYLYVEREISDLNRDGNVDQTDLEIMLHEVLGVPEKKEPAVTTVTALTIATAAMTSTTQPALMLYAPPPIMTTQPESIDPIFTEPVVRPLYGPPDAFDDLYRDTFREQPDDADTPKTTATQTKDTGAAG